MKVPYPVRFRTYEDAMLYEKCLASGREFPKENFLLPFKLLINGDAVPNPEYCDAPFEMSYFELDK